MKQTVIFIFFFVIVFLKSKTIAQSVAINNNGALPNASSILDINSTDKGLLIPRMTQAQRGNITTPAAGLLVYQTDGDKGFYFNSNTPILPFWKKVGSESLPSGMIVMSETYPNTELESKGFSIYGMNKLDNVLAYGNYGKWTPKDSTLPVSDNGTGVSAVWTGTEVIYWGGSADDDGMRYNPATGAITLIPSHILFPARIGHSAIWTGSEMIIWGGGNQNGAFSTGGKYNPVTNSWSLLATLNAPQARSQAHTFWNGTEMIVYGGVDNYQQPLNDGGKYNPTTNTWTPMNMTGGPELRANGVVVWTGTKLIVWGGRPPGSTTSEFGTGFIYNPATNTWSAMSTVNAPSQRYYMHYAFTGTELLVFGGYTHIANCQQVGNQNFCSYTAEYQFNGARYNVANDSWTPISTINAPDFESNPSRSIWTGYTWMFFNKQGYVYSPAFNLWQPMPETFFTTEGDGGPVIMEKAGDKVIIWGGATLSNGKKYFQSGAVWNALTNSWANKMSPIDAPYKANTKPIWTGTELVVFGSDELGDPTDAIKLSKYNPTGQSLGPTQEKTLYLYKKN